MCIVFSKCMLRHCVLRVFVSFCMLVFVRAILLCALNLDISTLFTTLFLGTSLQFILKLLHET